jgi:hypothetical protein
MATTTAAPAPSYPLIYDVQYPERLSRWLIFVKWILAIPHFLILYALGILSRIITVIALFAILFTKRYPLGLFNLWLGVHRWSSNVSAYTSLMRDEYPPFTMDPSRYAVTFDIPYPTELNRWLPLVKWLLAVPHYIVLVFLAIASLVVYVIAFFAILFTTKFPRGMFDFVVGVQRWGHRVNAYVALARDEYPPFSLKP